MNLKRHTADQLARIARDPMRAAFVHQLMRDVEHVTLQTGGSWGSAPGYYIGGEHTKPEPFTGWEGEVQS